MTAPRRATPFRDVEIDLAQLARNVARFRELNEGRALVVDVGANAWGHGSHVVIPALVELGVQGFIVARLDEAELVRELAADTVIVTTQHSAEETFERAVELNVAPAVRSFAELERCLAARVPAVVLVEDSGDGVEAFGHEELRRAADEAANRGVNVLPADTWARTGAELLGVSERDSVRGPSGLHPVLRLWGPVAATKRVGADEGVSYGYTYRTAGKTTLALVTLGYADGLSRSGSNRVAAVVDGAVHTVAGRVAMDAFMVDLGDVAAPALGTEATVVGDARRGEPTAQDQGRLLGMTGAEFTTRLTARPRRYGIGGVR